MPITVRRLDMPSLEELRSLLHALEARDDAITDCDRWTDETLAELPVAVRAVLASDETGPVALLFLVPGMLEPWGAPSDLLGGNPILPLDANAARTHAALLSEASAWIDEAGESGLEILLPMGPANMTRDDRQDAFFEGLGFRRFYYTMTRELGALPECPERASDVEIVPAAAFSPGELYANYAACTAAGEIELVSKQDPPEHREFFDSLADDTLGHCGSLALARGDRLVGFALVAPLSSKAAHLAWIGVLPDDRGQGFGRYLLCRVMQACRGSRVERLSLYTDTSVGAQTLYRDLGFSLAGTLTYRWRRCQARDRGSRVGRRSL
jgi:ribosomal protein S18 acetylase RimI-like enzyme